MMRACKRCGKDYKPSSNSQKYCSVNCQRAVHNEATRRWKQRVGYRAQVEWLACLMEARICEECGKTFTTNRVNTVCCSDECRKHRIKRMTKENQAYYRRWDKRFADNNN